MSKHYLIAGGTSGVGKETVRLLVTDGHKVTCACRDAQRLSDIPEAQSEPFEASDSDAKPNLPGSLDGFVYFPGTITLKPFHRLTDDDFRSDFEVNVLGAVRLLQQALPALKKSSNASVVFFSTVAVQTGLSFHASIASAKGALEGLVRSLAAELAPSIRVNAIAPSLTDTPLASFLLESEEKRRASADRHPLKRVGDPSETAQLVRYLLGEGSGFMTGQILKLDGGLSTVKPL